MTKLFYIAFFASLITITCCNPLNERITGNGELDSETRTISKADKIAIKGSVDVEITPGPPSIRVEADRNIIPYIITERDGSWLEVDLRDNISVSTDNPMKVHITTPSLYDLRVAGSGNIVATGDFDNGEKMECKIAGSGDVRLSVNTPRVEANIAGSGNVNISGETKDVDVRVAGSGNFNGHELRAENATVKIAGSGDVLVFADVNLKANIVGSGNVKYKGNATISQKVMGSGSISKIQ